MTIGQLELRLNTYVLSRYFYGPRDEFKFPWVTLSLRVPDVTLPIQKKNDLGEWERLFCISAPILIQISHCDDISWEGHFMVLGFGISFIYQYGY